MSEFSIVMETFTDVLKVMLSTEEIALHFSQKFKMIFDILLFLD